MNLAERALAFECEGEQLIAVVSPASGEPRVGVVIVVGGPQYRVGGHRQFVLLARHLAERGFPAFRFDYRGMGDSTGAMRTFEHIERDVETAIEVFIGQCPTVDRVVLVGLCDGASAALMYAPNDRRVAGVVMLNPWVFSEETFARSQIRHHYLRRFLEPSFWSKLLRGGVDLADGLRVLMRAGRPPVEPTRAGTKYQDRMAAALAALGIPVLLVLSGRDPTAQAFLDYCAGDPLWHGLLDRATVLRQVLADADHTFSAAELRDQLEHIIEEWLSGTVLRDTANVL